MNYEEKLALANKVRSILNTAADITDPEKKWGAIFREIAPCEGEQDWIELTQYGELTICTRVTDVRDHLINTQHGLTLYAKIEGVHFKLIKDNIEL